MDDRLYRRKVRAKALRSAVLEPVDEGARIRHGLSFEAGIPSVVVAESDQDLGEVSDIGRKRENFGSERRNVAPEPAVLDPQSVVLSGERGNLCILIKRGFWPRGKSSKCRVHGFRRGFT